MLGTVGVIIIILLCLPVTVPGFIGFNIYNVESGSMEPAIKTGSIVYVKSIDAENLSEGDIIAYNLNGMTITHRVVSNDTENKELITKGDANEKEDMAPVRYGSVIGIIKLSIPYLGAFFVFFTGIRGKIYIMGILVACFILMMVGSHLKDKSKYREKNKNMAG
ncbi:MAG: signal peptidase I [Lachnospiraceae bacterium]|nr:signal peptidase I [Lachnospiraceae bacterium]